MSSIADLERRIRALESAVVGVNRVGTVTALLPEKGAVRVEFGDRSNLVSYELPVMVKQTLKNKDSYMPDVGEHVVCSFLGNGLEQGFVLGAIYSNADTAINTDPDVRRTDFEDGTYHSYSRKDNVHLVHYMDGSEVKYDAQANKLEISIAGSGIVELNCKTATVNAEDSTTVNTKQATINAENSATVNTKTATVDASTSVTLDTPTTTCTGNLTVQGAISYGAGMTGTGGANVTGGMTITGGSLSHNGKNIGSTHTHTGVQTGPGTTGVPT